jgi:CheY-like chemotaxis protein
MNKKRIMVVDDETSFTTLLKLNLEKTGRFEVRVENQSRRALDVARAFRPDVLLLDVVMPVLDGGDVAALVKSDPELRNVPIVFITAVVSRNDANDCRLERGGHVFLNKPVNLRNLLECIDSVLPACSLK